jgi:hypothetical protein
MLSKTAKKSPTKVPASKWYGTKKKADISKTSIGKPKDKNQEEEKQISNPINRAQTHRQLRRYYQPRRPPNRFRKSPLFSVRRFGYYKRRCIQVQGYPRKLKPIPAHPQKIGMRR